MCVCVNICEVREREREMVESRFTSTFQLQCVFVCVGMCVCMNINYTSKREKFCLKKKGNFCLRFHMYIL